MSGLRAASPAASAPVAAHTARTNGQKASTRTKAAVASAWTTRVVA
ncbi:hypothetical protein PUR61_23675 [Streptomyces sp. BE20]|nr:hypothetical protein [Streptomyces sp. BE20]MEE1825159.1 hypothetical protein [Streptomyces sp. BE20]